MQQQLHSFLLLLLLFTSTQSKSEDAYLEAWQQSKIREPSFYETHAASRHWFYTIDLQGRLYLEESRVKNITSCLKNEKFLNFFFRQIRKNATGLHEKDYPFISPCGKEMNYILPADMPIVFHDLILEEQHYHQDNDANTRQEEEEKNVKKGQEDDRRRKQSQKGEDEMDGRQPSPSSLSSPSPPYLIYGGSLVQPFHPSEVYISHRTGRLYHSLSSSARKGQKEASLSPSSERKEKRIVPKFGLLRSHIGLVLSEYIQYDELTDEPYIEWNTKDKEKKQTYKLKVLPEEEEPLWGLPP